MASVYSQFIVKCIFRSISLPIQLLVHSPFLHHTRRRSPSDPRVGYKQPHDTCGRARQRPTFPAAVITHGGTLVWVPGLPKVLTNQRAPTAARILAIGQHAVQVLQARLLREHHRTLPKRVERAIQHDTVRRGVIPPCSATLLVEILHRLAEGVVEHEAHVGFVDPHTESYGCYNDLESQKIVQVSNRMIFAGMISVEYRSIYKIDAIYYVTQKSLRVAQSMNTKLSDVCVSFAIHAQSLTQDNRYFWGGAWKFRIHILCHHTCTLFWIHDLWTCTRDSGLSSAWYGAADIARDMRASATCSVSFREKQYTIPGKSFPRKSTLSHLLIT